MSGPALATVLAPEPLARAPDYASAVDQLRAAASAVADLLPARRDAMRLAANLRGFTARVIEQGLSDAAVGLPVAGSDVVALLVSQSELAQRKSEEAKLSLLRLVEKGEVAPEPALLAQNALNEIAAEVKREFEQSIGAIQHLLDAVPPNTARPLLRALLRYGHEFKARIPGVETQLATVYDPDRAAPGLDVLLPRAMKAAELVALEHEVHQAIEAVDFEVVGLLAIQYRVAG